MAEGTVAPATLKCKICGGELRNDYLGGFCVCAHCGNKWSIQDLVPDYGKYSRVIEKMNRAKQLLDENPDPATMGQARLMYKTAALECASFMDAVGSDLQKNCIEGQKRADDLGTYAKAKSFYDKKSYSRALVEFRKVPDLLDAPALIAECEKGVVKERKKRIPYAIIVGLILPTILCIALYEKFSFPLYFGIPIGLVLAAGLAFVIYRDGAIATIIQILSFVSAVPLIIFLILAYGFHMETGPAAMTAIGVPIAVVVALGLMPDHKPQQ
ncbi:MAG: hypothetical protein J6T40_10830 [Clostridiales bacterium]|jgi:hypothetical protein|nr:hypothetical protein [Clostridiales bacterium]MBR5938920.1 hypothetical protein [Clostridiales bacterium]